MIAIQTKSKFEVRIDYFDLCSHYYQLHNYKVTSAAIFRKTTLNTSHEANDGKLQQITSIFSNQPLTEKRENILQPSFGWFLTAVDG